jgi:hypothetical protein
VSATGTLVALTAEGSHRPAGRERTTIVVADSSGARPAREFDLAGNFEPEAFSADDAYLFVLEYLPANAPEHYRVRRVELATGQVQPLLLRDKQLIPASAEEEMRGEGVRPCCPRTAPGSTRCTCIKATTSTPATCCPVGVARMAVLCTRLCTCCRWLRAGPTASTCPTHSVSTPPARTH